jgi:glycosyltransferase involved in cell wall biosynthesis
MVDRIFLVHRSRDRKVDGIRDYGERLADELSSRSIEVEFGPVFRRGSSELRAWMRIWARFCRAGRGSAIVVQYNPFSFARWGFAPWLPAILLALKISWRRPRIAIMVHEPYVPMKSLKWTVMGLWQRFQLAALRLAADVVFASNDRWSDRFRGRPPRRPAHHLPVGSNLPDRRSERGAERRRCGLEDGTLAVAVIARDHETWLQSYAVGALNAIAGTGGPVTLLLLGAEAPALSNLDSRIVVQKTGYLPGDALGEKLAAADLFLAPLSDGVSTKRGTVMAALQHGLPVVATEGPATDTVLRCSGSAITLTPVGSPNQFATAAVVVATDEPARNAQATAARELYEQQFDWAVISEKLLAAL